LLFALMVISLAGCGKKSAIHDAVMTDDLEEVSAMLTSHPALVSSRDDRDKTPLFYTDTKEMAELLLVNKADVNATNNVGQTPLSEAARIGKSDVVEFLLAHGADVNITGMFGSPLHAAMMAREANAAHIAALLLAHGANVNAVDNKGDTCLQSAASSGFKDVAELLLANHADVDTKGDYGKTPLSWAALCGHKDVAELLLANKADINAKDNEGRTPLHEVAVARSRWADKDVAELLLANKADVNAKDNQGQTPLDLATANEQHDVAEFLRQHGGHT
jgi:cytohesin